MTQPALLSVDEVAKALGLNTKTVRAAILDGKIPGARYGRIFRVPRWWLAEQVDGPRQRPAA